jgi:Fe2+ transport system protein B
MSWLKLAKWIIIGMLILWVLNQYVPSTYQAIEQKASFVKYAPRMVDKAIDFFSSTVESNETVNASGVS